MSLGKSQAAQKPTAMGSLLNSSTYGATIPKIYGMTISPLLWIWAANLRQGGSVKKFKQLKKGVTAYVENIDGLLGHNPILGVNQMWNNGATIPLALATYSQGGGSGHIAIPNPAPSFPFYSVIGCTITRSYSVTFNDYGGTGPVTLTGTFEVPMWNELVLGPDPTHGSAYRNFPYCYRWQPSYGSNIYVDYPDFFIDTITVYFTNKTAATSNQGPLAHNRLAFEAELGSGTEYADAGLSSQQIIYPMFAGVGSSSIDLGSSGALPQLQCEVQGKFGLYKTGDCDFADMIEDTFKSGVAQASISASTTATTQVEHGLSCYQYPGCIQRKANSSVESSDQGPQTYNLPVTAGNYLVVIGTTQGIGGSPLAISDTGGNAWTPIFSSSNFQNAWYAKASASGVISVTVTGLGFDWHTLLLEVAGVDTFDSIAIGTAGTATVTTSSTKGWPGYLLSIGLYSPGSSASPGIQQWNRLTPDSIYGPSNTSGFSVQERVVYSPGNYSITIPTGGIQDQCIIAFKGANPPSYPKPVGDFIDLASLDQVRIQCRANGLWGSLSMSSQQKGSDWLTKMYAAADAAPVFMGFKLYSFPYSEVSAVGNGAIYTAPTASGPVARLTTENGDFVPSKDDAPIKIQTAARVNQPNVLQLQCINRASNYNPSVVEQPDAAGISLFGVRKADPVVNEAVQDVSIARQLLSVMVKKLQYGGDVIPFNVPAKWCLLAPMDLIEVSDPLASIMHKPVRLTSLVEQSDGSFNCLAEPFVYGMYAPSLTASISGTTTPVPYQPNTNQPVTGSGINPPIIFESTPRLAQQTSPAQIWCAVSCPDPNYGGCIPYISTDGGVSYHLASDTPMMGSAAMGRITTDWPPAADPDTAHDLTVNLTESLQPLASYSAVQRDKFQFPAYVGFSNQASATANFTVGDPTQITELDVLFSNPTILNALPSDAIIVNIFPVIQLNSLGPADPTATVNAYCGTGLTPTSGGALMLTTTSPSYVYYAPGIGTSLAGQGIRYALNMAASGGAATTGKITGVGWAISYSSATPTVDPAILPPFSAAGLGWACALPGTVTLGHVGTGTNASIVANGAVPPPGINYEIISYNKASLLGANVWTISATGTGNEIRRGVYGAPSPATGMDHPPGSMFALLDPSDTGVVKINMDPAWIGTQLWFKFLTFNTFGGSLQPPNDAATYPYTPTGIPGNIGPSDGFQINGM
jgi:hypothetical protein